MGMTQEKSIKFRGSMAHDSYYTQTSCRLEDRRRFLPPIAGPLRRLLNCWCTLSNWSLAISFNDR